jgi:hypothetical protein
LRTAPMEVHIKHKGLTLDDNWRVPKDVPIITFLHDLDSEHSDVGRGQTPLLGIDYFPATHAATMAIFLNEFEFQLCDPDLFDAVLPPAREIAFGILKPLDKVEFRIRKRTTSDTR